MRKGLFVFGLALVALLLTLPVAAQEATPEPTAEATAAAGTEAPSVTVSNQVVLNGLLTLDRVYSEGQGFVAIHVNLDGVPGPLVGIAPVQPGVNERLTTLIDTGGATPALMAMLHVDDNTVGVFEYGMVEGADQPVAPDGTPVGTPFEISAITAFDHQPMDGMITVASAIHNAEGWVVIHAEENGQPGAVLGSAPIRPGTNAPVMVPLAAEGVTQVVFPMLHVDDNEVGTYEFGQVEGADAPVAINNVVATVPINLTEVPTVLSAAGIPLGDGATLPTLTASDQALTGEGGAELAQGSTTANFVVDAVTTPFAGWIDVHADGGGHPGKSLGMSPVQAGENTGVAVVLDPFMKPTPPFTITPVVWPMLHVDDANPGVYDYLMIPGADLPVVVNGRVLTLPVNVTGAELIVGGETMPMDGMATAEATMEGMDGMMEATAEATPGS